MQPLYCLARQLRRCGGASPDDGIRQRSSSRTIEHERGESFGLTRVKTLDGIARSSKVAPALYGSAYTTVPNKTSTPAVIPIASAPQNVTRIVLGATFAPPARAASAPKSARKSSEVPATKRLQTCPRGCGSNDKGHGCCNSEAAGRCERRLDWTGSECLGDAEFVASMRAYGIMGHELVGDLFCERGIGAATNINCRQFLLLPRIVRSEFHALTCKVGLLGICLGVHRHVLARSHRHSPGDQASDPRDQHVAASPMRRRHTQHQTSGRKDAVVRAQIPLRATSRYDPCDAVPDGVPAYSMSFSGLGANDRGPGRLDPSRGGHRAEHGD